ncbi:MAG TPA: HAD family hydrolase [Candidatus Wunengus sp. YC60]|uniref:HAD family hydrolase n=1 Tax=Candidatus Wunengus sp. YC60 TaxID=3367697 RepID=UPI00402837BC
MIKYLFFDIYQTLLDVDVEQKNFDKAWRVFENYLIGRKIDRTRAAQFRKYFDEAESKFYANHDKSLHHHDWIDNIYVVLIKKYKLTISPKEAKSLFWSFRKESCDFCRIYPGVKETLEKLSQRYILSTASLAHGSITEIELEEVGIKKYFTNLIFTSQVGYRKPARQFFERALEISGAKASESMMIGDSLSEDIYGAEQIGMWTLWIKNPLTVNKTANVIPNCTTEINDFSTVETKINNLNEFLSLIR